MSDAVALNQQVFEAQARGSGGQGGLFVVGALNALVVAVNVTEQNSWPRKTARRVSVLY